MKSALLITVAVAAAIVSLAALFLYPANKQIGGVTELTFIRTGGIMGLNEKLVVKADGAAEYTSNRFGNTTLILDKSEAAALIEKSYSLTSEGVHSARDGAADYYAYRVTVQKEFDVRTFEWVDAWASEVPLSHEFVEIQRRLDNVTLRMRAPVGGTDSNLEGPVSTARDFIVQAPTFVFDGIPATLHVIDAVTLESFPEQHTITINFDSRHAGYGNREGLILAQVITHHTARIRIVNDTVVSAVLDGQWDELKQEPIPSLTIMT